jgi:nitroreductase/NAD-dependent dihydropyrimidine dehydrogenase PreA subunit
LGQEKYITKVLGMPILGIDYERCVNCGACLTICPARLFGKSKEKDNVVFHDPRRMCISCGHCIAGCPEEAILHKNMGDSYALDGVERPEVIPTYDSLYNLFQVHRSIRRYKKEKVPPDVLHKVFDAMQYAPTGMNLRSERISILSDEAKIKALSDAVQKELLGSPQVRAIYGEVFRLLAREFKSPIFYDAPHVIFVSSNMGVAGESNTIGIIVTYGRLAAQTLGLGTCWNGWTQAAMQINPKIEDLAGIQGRKIGVFTIGHPDVTFYRTAPRIHKSIKTLD